jgi:indole-3-glycerol phosphate synthase
LEIGRAAASLAAQFSALRPKLILAFSLSEMKACAKMRQLSGNLQRFITDTQRQVEESKSRCSIDELKRHMVDAPPRISFVSAIRDGGFGLIAEIKECSPSQGPMKIENVKAAPEAYRDSPVVRGISVLTNRTYFGQGMTLERLRQVKATTGKPVLRKDFVIDPYQIYEARTYGADAVLLMANILERKELHTLFAVAEAAGVDVLFETHTPEEISDIPEGAQLFGINCRNFDQSAGKYWISRSLVRFTRWLGGRKDLSIDFSRFAYSDRVPTGRLKIAESGVGPAQTRQLQQAGFHAVLVGTSLLIGPEPLSEVLAKFEREIIAQPR